jgi:hypothetical protein
MTTTSIGTVQPAKRHRLSCLTKGMRLPPAPAHAKMVSNLCVTFGFFEAAAGCGVSVVAVKPGKEGERTYAALHADGVDLQEAVGLQRCFSDIIHLKYSARTTSVMTTDNTLYSHAGKVLRKTFPWQSRRPCDAFDRRVSLSIACPRGCTPHA